MSDGIWYSLQQSPILYIERNFLLSTSTTYWWIRSDRYLPLSFGFTQIMGMHQGTSAAVFWPSKLLGWSRMNGQTPWAEQLCWHRGWHEWRHNEIIVTSYQKYLKKTCSLTYTSCLKLIFSSLTDWSMSMAISGYWYNQQDMGMSENRVYSQL